MGYREGRQAWTAGGRLGPALGLLVALGTACAGEPPPPAPASVVRLTSVRAVRHAGATLVATARAKVVTLDPDAATAHLTTARLGLPASNLTVRAPTVSVDLAHDVATGTDGVRVVGPTWHLTGRRFTLGPEPTGLTVAGDVDARGEASR